MAAGWNWGDVDIRTSDRKGQRGEDWLPHTGDIRKKAGLTQQEFADRVGCHRNQVSNVERGEYIPQDQFLVAVSREFKVGIDWLRTGGKRLTMRTAL